MLILGIDQSYSGLATTYLHDKQINTAVKAFPPAKYGTGVKRLWEIQEYIQSTLDPFTMVDPDIVCIEGYAYGSKFGRELAGELSAAIRLALWEMKIENILIVAPTLVKKFATGKGNASKTEVIAGIRKKWNYITDNDNIADSFTLAKVGQSLLYNSGDSTYSYEQEVIDEIRGINNGTQRKRKRSGTRKRK
jgi:crossover junction endodeoxyribonuclease RuvC